MKRQRTCPPAEGGPADHMRTVLSLPPVAISPSGSSTRARTASVWPERVCKHSPEGKGIAGARCPTTAAPRSPHCHTRGVEAPHFAVTTGAGHPTGGQCHHSPDSGRVCNGVPTLTFCKGAPLWARVPLPPSTRLAVPQSECAVPAPTGQQLLGHPTQSQHIVGVPTECSAVLPFGGVGPTWPLPPLWGPQTSDRIIEEYLIRLTVSIGGPPPTGGNGCGCGCQRIYYVLPFDGPLCCVWVPATAVMGH